MIVLKVPFSKGGLGRSDGSELAPDRIIEQSEDVYMKESGVAPIMEFDEIKVNQSNIEETNKNIIDRLKKFSFSEPVCLLGGDHSITYAGFKAFVSKHPGAGLIILDAHPDCESDTDIPSHEDFVRKIVSEKLVDRDRLIIVGIRNASGNENQFLEAKGIKTFTMKQIMLTGFNNVMDGITETISAWPSVYLSIDIDAADPSCAPGTGYIEPGGLTARQLINIIQRIRLLKGLRMVDIVEVNPKKDVNDMTSKLAAKLMVELA
jgi:arginase family enzyme